MKTTNKTSVRQQVEAVLSGAYGAEIASEILASYDDIINEFKAQHWKTSELDAGHFVEAVRRAIQHEQLGIYTPFDKQLSPLNEAELQKLAQHTASGDTFAILLPRALFAVYTVRNKRGVGHKGPVKPNEMDAAYIVSSTKWILAEIVRAKSNLPPTATMRLIEQIVEREISVLWSWDDITRVLDTGMTTRSEVLILLYGSKDPMSDKDLLRFTEYSNKGMFEDILRKLHKERLIEYSEGKGVCVLTPKGMEEAEKILIAAKP